METKYKENVWALGKNLDLFKKSVLTCNIADILDSHTAFVETLKNTNKTFESLSPTSKQEEDNELFKSKSIVKQYFDARANINTICSCKLVSKEK